MKNKKHPEGVVHFRGGARANICIFRKLSVHFETYSVRRREAGLAAHVDTCLAVRHLRDDFLAARSAVDLGIFGMTNTTSLS